MSIEKQLERAWLAAIAANPVIASEAIKGFADGDNSHERGKEQYIVYVKPAQPIPASNHCQCEVEFIALTAIASDKDCARMDEVYSALFDTCRTMTPAALTALTSGLTVDGIVRNQPGSNDDDDDFHWHTCKCTCFVTPA